MKAFVTDRKPADEVKGTRTVADSVQLKDVPDPTLGNGQILVQVKAVALNPTDWKHMEKMGNAGAINGCDYAGVVAKLGPSAEGTWKVGDRVAGVVHGGLFPDQGAFAEFLKTDADLVWRVPEDVSDAEAAVYGISAVTGLLSIHNILQVPWPDHNNPVKTSADKQLLVYAASTAAGIYHVQMAKAAGYTVIGTASPHSFDLLKSYGIDAVFDYHSDKVVEEITAQYPNIRLAVDCFAEGKSMDVCAGVLSKAGGGKLVSLLPGAKCETPGVEHHIVMMYTLFNHDFQMGAPHGPKFKGSPEDRARTVEFYAELPRIVKALRPPPLEVLSGGFDAILTGLNRLREGKVSGKKLIALMD